MLSTSLNLKIKLLAPENEFTIFAVNSTIQTEHILYLLPHANLETLCQGEGDGTINAFYYLYPF